MAMLAALAGSDFRVSARFHSWKPPRWFRIWMHLASRMGDGWIWLAIATVIPFLADRRPILATLALAALVANVAQFFLKRGVRRRRPIEYAARFAFDEFSFPSGHSLNAFAMGTVLCLAFPAVSPLVLLLAGSIALSRVTQGFHFVGDVLAGTAIGTVIGGASFWMLIG